MNFFWKFIDHTRRQTTVVGKFIFKNKIYTIYIKRNFKHKNVFLVKSTFKKYMIDFYFPKSNKKLPKDFGYWLKDYLTIRDNWNWLIDCYNATGNVNCMIDRNLTIPNYERM